MSTAEPTSPATKPEIIILELGDRVYEIVPCLELGEESVLGDVAVQRAEELSANLSEDEGSYIISHYREIPAEFEGTVTMVFTGWRHTGSPRNVANLYWHDGQWFKHWTYLGYRWGKSDRLVRRIK